MATPTAALLHILRAQRGRAPPTRRRFERYRSAYRDILVEMRTLGGDEAIDRLTEWIIEHTISGGELPHPDVVRAEGRAICERRSISIPRDSPLRYRGQQQRST